MNKDITLPLAFTLTLFIGLGVGFFLHNPLIAVLNRLEAVQIGQNPANPGPGSKKDAKTSNGILDPQKPSNSEFEANAEFFKAAWRSCVESIDEQTLCLKEKK